MTGDFVPNIDQCLPCLYWRSGGGTWLVKDSGLCHHLLDTGKCRQRDADGNCLSFVERQTQINEQEETT